MDFFQGIVAEYLRADRSCFINTEFYLQNDLAEDGEDKKKHWFIDILALHMSDRTAYLCEVTYAKQAYALKRKLDLWHKHWPTVCETLRRDAKVPENWRIRPWVFVPEQSLAGIKPFLELFDPKGRYQVLEKTLPWTYKFVLDHSDSEPDAIN
jgi:hypothetical protein